MRSYETDYAGWAEDTAHAIEEGRWSEIDRVALADEVGDLARQERRAIRSRLEILFLHLLKKQFQPVKASRSWDTTILNQRLRLRELLAENPSLATTVEFEDAVSKAYKHARLRASSETGLALEAFPLEMPFDPSEIWGGISPD